MVRASSGVLSIAILGLLAAPPASAGEADVVAARAVETAPGVWRIDATVAHADEGWEHYADGFEVLAPDGTVLGVRTLYHPHVDEQPFTRSLQGLEIPDGIDRVRVRAHDSVHGDGGAEIDIVLER